MSERIEREGESLASVESALLSGLRQHAGLAVTIGFIMIVCGFLAVGAPLAAGLVVTITVGVLLIVAGVSQCVLAFRAGAFGSGLLLFVIGILTTLAGAFLSSQPLAGLAEITLILMIFFVVSGLFELFGSLQIRPAQGWGWMAFNGAITLLLGSMIWQQYPLSGAWAVGVLFGIRLVLTGWALVTIGGALRRATPG
jgi:uncharacterized membrane protein HdeD (DUF308 family)